MMILIFLPHLVFGGLLIYETWKFCEETWKIDELEERAAEKQACAQLEALEYLASIKL